MKIKCTECKYLTMRYRSGGLVLRTDGANITANIRSLKDFQQRLSETEQDALYVSGQMNVRQNQQ